MESLAGPAQVNAEGAEVGVDDFYKLPIYEHQSIDAFTPTSEVAIHRIAWKGGTIVLAAAIRESPLLTVVYQGALEREKHRVPFFHRLQSRKRSSESFIVFADPTLDLAPNLGLAWYIGAAEHDPTGAFLDIVRRTQDVAGAKAVAFCGASGGGFAALQHSAKYPGSIAVAFNPQTDVYKYYRRHRELLLTAAFPGHTPESARGLYEDRFSVLVRYRKPLLNRVRYVMNQRDPHHVEKHLQPFADIFGLSTTGGCTNDGLIEIVPVDLGEGHVSPPQEVFESHLAEAYKTLGFDLTVATI